MIGRKQAAKYMFLIAVIILIGGIIQWITTGQDLPLFAVYMGLLNFIGSFELLRKDKEALQNQ